MKKLGRRSFLKALGLTPLSFVLRCVMPSTTANADEKAVVEMAEQWQRVHWRSETGKWGMAMVNDLGNGMREIIVDDLDFAPDQAVLWNDDADVIEDIRRAIAHISEGEPWPWREELDEGSI